MSNIKIFPPRHFWLEETMFYGDMIVELSDYDYLMIEWIDFMLEDWLTKDEVFGNVNFLCENCEGSGVLVEKFVNVTRTYICKRCYGK